MDVATGGGRTRPPGSKFRGTSPQKSRLKNLNTCQNFQIFQYFKIKWAKFEGKSELGVGGFDSPKSTPPPPASWNPLPPHPQSKLRGALSHPQQCS